MIPPPFRYHRPTSAAEAASLLAEAPGSVLLAGGQSLVNALKLNLVAPTAVIDIHRLDELRGIEVGGQKVTIGAATTYAELAAYESLKLSVPMLAGVCGTLVDSQVRNRGTIGGNVCLNDPTSNLPPLLAALGASFDVLTTDGINTFDAQDFFLGSMLTAAAGAVLTAVTVPATPPTARVFYRHQQVGADSWAVARVVGAVTLGDTGLAGPRLFLAAVPGSPRRLTEVEAVLEGASAVGSERWPSVVRLSRAFRGTQPGARRAGLVSWARRARPGRTATAGGHAHAQDQRSRDMSCTRRLTRK